MSPTIATVNVNGVRAAFKKGMAEWLSSTNASIIALQEVRAPESDLLALFEANGGLSVAGGRWHIVQHEASAKGRAGVALISSVPLRDVSIELGAADFDSAGRWIEATVDTAQGPLRVVSCYVHAGEVDTPKQVEKYKFLDAMTARMSEITSQFELALVLGDLNVGHTELDIKNWKGNLKNSGFLPEERAYFDGFMHTQGWVDVGRSAHPGQAGPYTWWSFRGQAFDTDAGWRIDYHLATPALAAKAKNYRVDRAPSYDSRWTDHSPVLVDYEL